jgi:hypothetical protein
VTAKVAPTDIEEALRELAAYRERNDNLTQAQVLLADRLTSYASKLIPAEEREIAGKAMVRAATALAALVQFDVNPAALCNIQMLAGERMVAEARGRKGGDHG